MKTGIMQPYLFPYIGYFQLISAVDNFVVYDEIEYTKKGWINRNRILDNKGEPSYISLPLKKDSDYLNIDQRYIAASWRQKECKKVLNRLNASYRKASYFEEVYPYLESTLRFDNDNLFEYIYHSIEQMVSYLDIDTKLIKSSSLNCDNQLKKETRVINICKSLDTTSYINPIGGTTLYDKRDFTSQGINLNFLRTGNIIYDQFKFDHVPYLSIIDVLMFNSKSEIKNFLTRYTLE